MKRRSLVFAACALAVAPVMAADSASVDKEVMQGIRDLNARASIVNLASFNLKQAYMLSDKSLVPSAERDLQNTINAFEELKKEIKPKYRKLNSEAKKKAFIEALKAVEAKIKDPTYDASPTISALEMELDI